MEERVLLICTFYCSVCQIVHQIAPGLKEGPHPLLAAQEGALQGASLDGPMRPLWAPTAWAWPAALGIQGTLKGARV